ncbi:MAG: TlpA family protein disulfide reductase [Polyangiaceae bacterium]|nr:TlpA family protein disulfide reductase [Myxococcales bacterium]MCB9587452.1 TlpA family protein disulfide reductase [Polyangiaceae bacterium]MCB9605751.1 TlpA family protein disulfide reductase [Polyangiaceae bacterium]
MRRSALLLCVLLCAACAPSGAGDSTPRQIELEGDMGLLEPFRAISPKEPVPHFMVMDTEGGVHDSRRMLGQGPILINFFASWCESCAAKAPLVNQSLKNAPPHTTALAVSLDDNSTWKYVENYVDDHGLDYPVIRGAEFAKFALAFDPVQAVPTLVVVGVDGYVVDFQVGLRAGDAERLPRALQRAATPAGHPTADLTPHPTTAKGASAR